MSRRILFSFLLLGLTCLSALAQSYQTAFSDVKFDRAKGPATFHSGVEVDAATGAASMTIPFGPGIGERGLKFRPLLSMRMAPQLRISSSDEERISSYWFGDPTNPMTYIQTVDTLYQAGFGSASFSPGTIDIASMVTTLDRKKTTYSLPGGGGGRCSEGAGTRITAEEVQSTLLKFGFSANDMVGYRPGSTTRTSKTPYLEIGTTGHLVVGLRIGGAEDPTTHTTDEVVADIQQMPSSQYRWDFPRRMAIIQEDVVYEYHYVNHNYTTHYFPYLTIGQKTQLNSAHYVLTKIRNRFGESISFVYDADAIGYTATLSTTGGKILVEVVGTPTAPPGQPWLSDGRFTLSRVTQIRVTYQGISQPVSPYLLEVADPNTGGSLEPKYGGGPDSVTVNRQEGAIEPDTNIWDAAVQSIQPVRILQVESNEEIKFAYGAAPSQGWSNWVITPTVLSSVTFPARTVDLTWEPYPFRMNYSPEGWGGVVSSSARRRPAFAYGVTEVSEYDPGEPYRVRRTTTHKRVVPQSNWVSEIPPPGDPGADAWVNFTFYDAITHPDGTVSVHRFVEPPVTNTDSMENLAFLKAIEKEVRCYAGGATWQSELSLTNPAGSTAYKWVVKDRFDIKAIGSNPVPYPTRIRIWDKESQILSTEENTDWDGTAHAWKTSHRTTSITSAPDVTMDYLSLSSRGQGYVGYPATQGVYRKVDKSFEPKPLEWVFARVKTEQSTTVQDNTGFNASDVGLPDVQPLLTKTFHTDLNRVESLALSNGGSPTITTAFSYQGTTGLAASELLSVYVSSPGLGLSGVMGTSYGYDANGYLNAIHRKPNAGTTLTLNQESDELGRPKTQTDMNGTVTTFGWDGAGRLRSITSSDGDEPTSVIYDDTDHRGIKVTRGAQVTEYRYNCFGQLILERRKGPDGVWSHRIHGYHVSGRKTGETTWQPGDGSNHEGDWTNYNLVRSTTSTTTVTTPEKTICKKWGLDGDGNAVCITWQYIPESTTTQTTTTNPLYPGVATEYDPRGRVTFNQDANGIQTTIEYFGPGSLPPGVTDYVGPIKRVTTGGTQVKWLEQDAAGRLVRVTTPVTRHSNPLIGDTLTVQNLRTEYRYDGGDRIKEVKQLDEAGRTQTRTWGYNSLGWLTSLVQPESGTTTYGSFTVVGKPTVYNYNGRQVTMIPDWMGRPLTVNSTFGPVSQSFTYDTAFNGQGRIASSTDGSINTAYTYAGQGKRLSSLVTTAVVQGTAQTFTQQFGYDTYGNRISGNTSHGGWTQSYHAEAGLPNVLKMGTTSVASIPWTYYDPVSWVVKSIVYGNGAASSFDYGPDQARLSEVKHLDGQMAVQAHWNYSYDLTGNLAREYDKTRPDGAGSWAFDQYGYDELNRLISAVIQSPTYGEQLQQFDYDAFGNRTSCNLMRVTGWSGPKGAATSVAYTTTSGLMNSQNNQVLNASFTQGTAALLQNHLPATTSTGVPTGAVYDSQGNLTRVFEKPASVSPVALSMTYDALGRVLSLSSTRTGITEIYQYTAEGLRTVVQEYSGSTLQKTRVNIHNDSRQLVSQYEKTAAGALIWRRDILYLGTRGAAEFDAAGMHVTQVDHLGSPRVITGPSGQVESRQKYLPFGETLEQTPNSLKTTKGYTNHEQTDSSGLIYMQARFYMPGFGRFLSTDPALDQHFEETQSWNIYSYVQNNPVMFSDPNGQWRTGIHNKIIAKAFEGRYSVDQIRIIQNASRDFDLGKGAIGKRYPGTQDPSNSPWHSMTPAGGDPSDAKASRDAFVEQTIDQAAQLRFASEKATGDEKTNLENQALELVGIAQHPVADETSPSHEGFQKWAGVEDVVTAVKGAAHVGKESVISKKRLAEAAKRVKAVDDRVNKKVEELRKKEEEQRKTGN